MSALWAACQDVLVSAARHPMAFGMMKLARVAGSVRYWPGAGYVIVDPALARAVLVDEANFSKSGRGAAGAVWNQILGPMSVTGTRGDDHRMLRHLLAPALNRSALDDIERRVLTPAALSITHAIDAGKTVELAGVGRRLSLDAVCALLGIPTFNEAELATFFDESDALFRRIGFRTNLKPDQLEHARKAVARFVAPVEHALRSNAFEPGSLLEAMLRLNLSLEDRLAVASILLINGTGASSAAIPRIAALVIDSGQLPSLRSDPSRIARAAEEGLRYVTPSPFLVRAVEHDVTVQGTRFRSGRRVLILVEGVTELKRIWFGAGRHFCPGADLGQWEIEAVLRGLASASSGVRITRRRYRSRGLLPTYRELVVGPRDRP